MRAAMFRMSPQFLLEALHLPQGTRLIDVVHTMHLGHPMIEVYVENEEFDEVIEGMPWPQVTPTYRRTASHDHVKFVGWGAQ